MVLHIVGRVVGTDFKPVIKLMIELETHVDLIHLVGPDYTFAMACTCSDVIIGLLGASCHRQICSDELTKRDILKKWHPNYQKWLDDAGVKATVASGVTSSAGSSAAGAGVVASGSVGSVTSWVHSVAGFKAEAPFSVR